MENTKNNKEKTPYQQYKYNLQQDFGKYLSEAKRKKGLTNSDLCEKVQKYFLEKGFSDKQISENTVNAHLSGKTHPDIAYLFAYADILEVSLDYLFKGIEKEKGENLKEVTPYNLLMWLDWIICNSECIIDDSKEQIAYIGDGYDSRIYKGLFFKDHTIEDFLIKRNNPTIIEALNSLAETLGSSVDPRDLLVKSVLKDCPSPNDTSGFNKDGYIDIDCVLPF